jgi:starch phosphorylase
VFELSGVYFPELQFRKIGRKINHKRNERKIFGGSKMRTGIQEELELYMSKSVAQASNREIYEALLLFVQKLAAGKERAAGKKKLYYISAEFLIGKLLSNNMINLGIYDEVKEMLFQNGKDICQIEEVEPEPSLGNGGLGRLAACFLDSIATLGLPGDGIGLNYHLGLFKQEFKDHLQKELPNPWIEKQSWLTKTDVVYPVSFRGLKVNARMYDIAVTGYHDQTNKLHLFDIDSVDEGIVEDGIHFDKEDIAKNLTLFLYPDDSDEKGRLLRIYQQYFMVSSAAQMILDECVQKGSTLYDLPDYAVIQINDTHPTMVIPELIRLLVERGLDIDEAIDVVSRTCAYTNHTILVEALEKWPIGYLKKVVPQLVPIIEILDDKVRRRFSDESTAIIDRNDTVHMAHIDIHYGFSVNGVAALHTDILKQSELNHFYKIYPDKFNNKTNGITFRRWLLHCNPRLTALLDETIKDEYKEDASKLVKLLEYKDDETVLKRLLEIKKENKKDLAAYLKETQAIEIDADTIFDIQVKRLHEYKRQQLNALYIIDKYLEIKEGILPKTPITAIFGAKAAPAYVIAKDIIHLILCLQEIINNDPEVSPYLKVVMVENYNVTKAEKLIPACDISEQISLASKEASGTGNMKFMLNGAVTLGTEDGANVEIHELVGDDNIFVFGASSDEVIEHYKKADYSAKDYYKKNPKIKAAVDFITEKQMMKIGCKESLERLQKELIGKDWFMTFLDFDAYKKAKDKALAAYTDQKEWAKKMLVNIAEAGYFSSDRTIEQYNRDIWKLTRS